ncbi:hypothetical protein GKR58_19940 [Yersinia pseudotuberculosis]|nr:hypothetical protein [Yersinia pseudotuberculosis]
MQPERTEAKCIRLLRRYVHDAQRWYVKLTGTVLYAIAITTENATA